MAPIQNDKELLNYFALLTPITMLGTTATISLSIAIMFLSSLYLLKTSKTTQKTDKNTFVLSCLFLSVFLFSLPHVVMDNFKFQALDTPSRYLMAAIIVIGFQSYYVKFETFLKGCIGGAFVGFGIYILYADLYLHAFRLDFDAGIGPLHLAYLSLAFFAVTLAGLLYFVHNKQYKLALLCFFSNNFVSYIVLESGTRGALVGIFILPILLSCYLIKKSNLKVIPIVLFSPLIIGLLIPGVLTNKTAEHPSTGLQIEAPIAITRLNNERNILDYTPGHANSSLTLRFEIWRSSFYQFMENPIFGLGYVKRKEFHNNLIKQGVIDEHVWSSNGRMSGHNEFFHIIGTKGLIGLSFILALYFIPLKFFYTQLKHNDPRHYVGLAGILLVLSFMITGLTEAPLMKHKTAVLYCLFIYFLYKSCTTLESKNQGDKKDA